MIRRGKTGALAAPCSKPGLAPRDAGANGAFVGPDSVLCQDLPGRRWAPGTCGSTNARALLSNGRVAGSGRGGAAMLHSPVRSPRRVAVWGRTPHAARTAALLREKRANVCVRML